MNNLIYLKQSRRIYKIFKRVFGIKNHWTNYNAWEYSLLNGIKFELAYTDGWNFKRFSFYSYTGSGVEIHLRTDSFKEAFKYLQTIELLNK